MYMMLVAALLPAIILFLYIWRKDAAQPEPFKWLFRALLAGAGLCVPVALVEMLISNYLFPAGGPTTLFGTTVQAFFVAAVPEECAKLLALWLVLRKNPYFDERFDGIVYACCVGMGFAGTENIIYLLGNIDAWESVAVQRAIFAVPGHFMFAVAMGYFYSMLYFGDMSWRERSRIIWVPVTLHTIYDGLLFMASLGTILSGLLVIAFYVFCYFLFRGGQRRIAEHLERDKNDPNQVAYYAKK